MRKIIILLCLGLMGCATAPKGDKLSARPAGKMENKTAAATSQEDLDKIIVMFSEVIRDNPNYAGAYYNRGMAYFYKHEYSKSLQDILKAKSLGITVNQAFIDLIKKLNKITAGKN